MALDGGRDGLDEVRRMAAQVSAKLSRKGSLLLEIGYGQEEEAVRLLHRHMPNAAIEVTPDLGGVPRLVTAALSG
jgi:methylase of polypeptide subunit release factors